MSHVQEHILVRRSFPLGQRVQTVGNRESGRNCTVWSASLRSNFLNVAFGMLFVILCEHAIVSVCASVLLVQRTQWEIHVCRAAHAMRCTDEGSVCLRACNIRCNDRNIGASRPAEWRSWASMAAIASPPNVVAAHSDTDL